MFSKILLFINKCLIKTQAKRRKKTENFEPGLDQKLTLTIINQI
jgi:hypothetical protein